MKKVWDKIVAFLQKYPKVTHLVLLAWNAFITSWATGLAVPLSEFGIPFSINARVAVSWLQLHAHIPTSVIGISTLVLNGFAYYINWKKTHQQVDTQEKKIETPTAEITETTVKTTDVQEK